MKSIKRFFWATLFLLVVGVGSYYPLTKHAVIYQSSLFFVPKAGLSFQHTYLNLDKNPNQWCVIHKSSTLYNHFKSHHFMATMRTKLTCATQEAAQGLWNKVKTGVNQGINQSVNYVKRETPKQFKKLKKQAIQGGKYLQNEAKKQLKELSK